MKTVFVFLLRPKAESGAHKKLQLRRHETTGKIDAWNIVRLDNGLTVDQGNTVIFGMAMTSFQLVGAGGPAGTLDTYSSILTMKTKGAPVGVFRHTNGLEDGAEFMGTYTSTQQSSALGSPPSILTA